MESHVTGQNTPLSLGELRQAILAVVVGNKPFSREERLLTNHQVFDCETAQQLTALLHQVQQRALLARAQRLAETCSPIADQAAQWADVEQLLKYPTLDQQVARCIPGLFQRAADEPRRVSITGEVYAMILSRLGYFNRAGFELN